MIRALTIVLTMLVACTPSASAATLAEIEALNAVSCEFESRAEPFRDLASSVAGAKGRCQILPATALWMVPHAVRMGHLPADYLTVRSIAVWTALLSVPWVSDALAMTYKQWIAARRDRSLRMIAYLYHAGQDARWRTGTESWRHSAEVYLAYQARRMAAGKAALVARPR